MVLASAIKSESILASLETGAAHYRPSRFDYNTRTSDANVAEIPKFQLSKQGIAPAVTKQLIQDELELDGRPNLNLASFVNTWISDSAKDLVLDNMTKNLADNDEYPALMALHQRCVSMLGHLWHAPDDCTAVGTATTGSSEAIHLGGLAMKRRWEARRKAEGKSYDKPNILMGANAQVALEKFARYFDVECRLIPVCKESNYCLDTSKIRENLDENTIGIYVILGSTYTGHYEPVETVHKILDDFENETGNYVPIHVDGASGAMVAPFVQPHVKWDFQLPRVLSINTSGHKFGLVTAGLGWVLWKDKKYLPESLLFVLAYLGGEEESYTLNFSRPGYQVIHQYYNFVSLGFEGYERAHGHSLTNARLLAAFLEATGVFEVVSDIHRAKGVHHLDGETKEAKSSEERKAHAKLLNGSDHELFNPGLPVVSFRLTDEFKKKYPEIPQSLISYMMRQRGFIVPNYPLPPDAENIEVLRVVVRYSLSMDLLDLFMEDIVASVNKLVEAVDSGRNPKEAATQDEMFSNSVNGVLSKLAAVNDQLIEHEDQWKRRSKYHKESGTRSKHSTVC